MKTKLTAAFVIGYDGNDHVIYHDGELVYQDDRIEFVGHNYPHAVDQTIDAGLAMICPGFIDLDALADGGVAQGLACGVRTHLVGDDRRQRR